jgi:aryl-alcohol dehydrogenase-like predicted oxidoreductase
MPSSPKRRLGRSNLEVFPLMLGGNVFGWTADEGASFAVLDAYVAAGGNFIDTADVYSTWVPGHAGGESELIIGRWMKKRGNRDRIIIATKLGSPMGPGKEGLSPGYIREAVHASLARLQTDCIDLYQAHQDDPYTPLELSLGAFTDLIREGKVRAIGASNYTADRLTEALDTSRRLGLARYESLQPEYNLHDRAPYETELEAICAREELGVVPYYALAAGFLTGKYRGPGDASRSPRGQRVVSRYLNDRGLRILAALDEVARENHTSQATVALAWLMARSSITAPIASAAHRDQVRDLVAATELHLTPDALDRLNRASNYREEEIVVG